MARYVKHFRGKKSCRWICEGLVDRTMGKPYQTGISGQMSRRHGPMVPWDETVR